jgi:hypothetical protein
MTSKNPLVNHVTLESIGSGEPGLGLVDGAYAIILTLLVIELPSLIIEVIDSAEETNLDFLTTFIVKDILEYGLVAAIIFGIWSCHKYFLIKFKKSTYASLLSFVIIFVGTLIPPIYYVHNHFYFLLKTIDIKSESVQAGVSGFGEQISYYALIENVFLLFLVALVLIVYLLFLYLSRTAIAQAKKELEVSIVRDLAYISSVAIFRSAIVFLVFSINLIRFAFSDSSLGSDISGLSTLDLLVLAIMSLLPKIHLRFKLS